LKAYELKRILCATTTYFGKDGKLVFSDAAWASIKALDTNGLAINWILLIENPFKDTTSENIAFKLERARRMALRLNYDYLFSHESDVILPVDTLQKLVAANGDVATGVTRLRPTHGVGSDICLLTRLEKPFVASNQRTRFDRSYDVSKLRDYKIKAYEKKTFPVEGSGLACLLISRRVLKTVPFRWIPAEITFDIEYATQVRHRGFKWLCVGSVQCGHEDSDHTIIQIGPQFWDATLLRKGDAWEQFSKSVPIAPVKDARLHLGPRPKQGWINYDVEPLADVSYAFTPIDKFKPHLPFEDYYFTEICVEGFAERVLDKAMLIEELWRISRDNAVIILSVTNDSSNPRNLSTWPINTFDYLGDKFVGMARSSKGKRLVWNLRTLKGR
jgi:hypothetical protein